MTLLPLNLLISSIIISILDTYCLEGKWSFSSLSFQNHACVLKENKKRTNEEIRRKQGKEVNKQYQSVSHSHLNCGFCGACSLDAPIGSSVLCVLKENAFSSIMAFMPRFSSRVLPISKQLSSLNSSIPSLTPYLSIWIFPYMVAPSKNDLFKNPTRPLICLLKILPYSYENAALFKLHVEYIFQMNWLPPPVNPPSPSSTQHHLLILEVRGESLNHSGEISLYSLLKHLF